MGDLNQLSFIKFNLDKFREPYLEIGTRYGLTQKIRALFPNSDYTGLDMESGPGVDVVADLTEDFKTVNRILGAKRFNTIFCLSVLEHCKNPFLMCENIMGLLAPNGVVYVSVPFAWKFHEYPSDYWRFTPEGIKVLFPDLEFNIEDGNMSTSQLGDLRRIDNDLCRIRFSVSHALTKKRYGMAITAAAIKLVKALGAFSWIFGYPYLFPPVMINMMGVKTQPGRKNQES